MSKPSVTNTSLDGHLHLVCSARPDGTPFISSQDFRAPVHIGKGHVDQNTLVLNIANPTAGFFDGDRVDTDVTVRSGAMLCLSTPAAARVYSTRSGKAASNYQKFRMENDGVLEWNPEPFIPHAGASYHQSTELNLAAGASLLFLEWLAPGRVAMGEVFAYRNLRWELDLLVGGRLVARERYQLEPLGQSLEALRVRFPAAHYLSVYVAGRFVAEWPADLLDELQGETVCIGHGHLPEGIRVIRALCADSVSARTLAGNLRQILYQSAGMRPPALGRVPC